ncbi:DNA replication/repair protein RecF [Psychroflexus planctonicus]|uniref:DNA replication and repair protein RecF n=1 Tax=Psychroflexus planctonicus TaxID=1526575 RepID=A0ABQ1SF50_9FLAO|nr:DNA replication and repair protein RecF [Psychroflexus planctonicus]GGE28122.1 DNA replication and repair protein RecF [Psychroflexus planctonicus]
MILNDLSIINFKNINHQNFSFNAKINCFVGRNGVGKTNILDSIYLLAFGKSYFNPITKQNIQHGEDFFVVDGSFEKNGSKQQIVVSVKKGQKKIIKKNAKVYDKISDHIGEIPLVIISPADRDLIIEGSETRRRFVDSVISQGDKSYLTALINYQKVVSQRNALLKYFAANYQFDASTLQVYNQQMADYGEELFTKRLRFIEEFQPILQQRYQDISNAREKVSFTYKSQLQDENFEVGLQNALEKDKRLQYSNFGIHKDDFQFEIENYPIKKFGSQGQQKSYLIALKFAQYDFMKAQKGTKPLLLLDDIFDKLDEERVQKIIEMVMKDDLGQLFISDTHAQRTENVVKENTTDYQIFELT